MILQKKQHRAEEMWQFKYEVFILCEKEENAVGKFSWNDQIYSSEQRQI